MPRPAASARGVIGAAVMGLLVACGGDSPGAPSPTGRLTVVVSGIPAGVAASIQVSGPGNYREPVLATTTFAQLVPGAYQVTAGAVASGGVNYQPVPVQQTRNVGASVPDTPMVAYGP
jgi:hypothetical protein